MSFQSCILAFFLCHTLSLGAVDFNRDIRPLLASKCYTCHGPDKESRKAKLRLDLREEAIKKDVIVPGKLEDSELHYRIRSDDPEEIMPPSDSKVTLSDPERNLLEKWIVEGAKYDRHWAFVPPVSP
ncbi:MAG: c-type cytochrome domain-containing protein, partial [Roseibacillus sp.]|nr:c-type cytochrome domain-containing protein [Roseibacillus sp.]